MPEISSQCAVTMGPEHRHCKRPLVAGTDYCRQHQREPDPTEEDYLLILKELAAPGVFALAPFEICRRIVPSPAGDGRTREHRHWQMRTLTLRHAEIDLHDRGLIYEAVPADGLHSYEVRITDAGREVLARSGA